MNKPAPKEPSMDEILSSIRQIIADDDAGSSAAAAPTLATPPMAEDDEDEGPLALRTDQIVKEQDDVASAAPEPLAFDIDDDSDDAEDGLMAGAPLVDPDDIAFAADQADDTSAQDDDITFPSLSLPDPEPVKPSKPEPAPVASAAPMPDASLSDDIAEELLEPTTRSAVQNTFAKLNSMSTVGTNVTIEQMMRDMLKPMLKEWLDENLPAVVERMVEREITRASRGGR